MKSPVMLKVVYLFDADEVWSSMSEFEKDQADFLSEHGKQGINVRNIRGAAEGELIIMVKAKNDIDRLPPPPTPKHIDIKSQLNKVGKQVLRKDK